ncbi:hypothetical protein [Arachnia propionica]|nr:hypothetical protein [Arachnia propionica]
MVVWWGSGACEGVVEGGKGFFEGGGGDGGGFGGGVVEVDGFEEGMAEQAADGVGDVGVEGADVGHEVEAGGQHVMPDGQALVGVAFLVLESGSGVLDCAEALFGGVAGDVAVGEEVDDAFFLGGQGA